MTFKNAESPTRPRRAAGPASREGRYRSGASRRPTGRRLFGQVGSVLTDLPLFLTAPLYRRWHRRWGSTADEVASVMPGDDLFLKAQFISTRSITIDAPPAAVWPWLVQVGCGRAGFYSNDLLDNLGRPSATTIVTMSGGTRLVTRIHAVYDWRNPLTAILGVVLMEFGDFAMMRRMLRGIRTRSESVDGRISQSGRRR